MRSDFHYLVNMAYRPRILIYTNASLILGSLIYYQYGGGWLIGLLIYTLLFPHVAYWTAGKFCVRKASILNLQYLDSLFTGVTCASIAFSPMPTITFLSALVISNLCLGGTRVCLVGGLWFLLGCLLVIGVTGFQFVLFHGFLTTILSGASILLYSGTVAYLAFTNARDLTVGKNEISVTRDQFAVLTDKLRKYISPQVYRSIFEGDREAIVHTSRKKLVVFFSDIEGFTELTDNMEAEALTSLLNEYLHEMASIALDFGGTIDKFLGDGVMIFFGDPVSSGTKEDAIACVQMALEMKERMIRLRGKWESEGVSSPLHIRMGIHTGFCTVGNFGCESRLDYTIIGSSVNLASRLESSAGRDEILISHETHALVRDETSCRQGPALQLKGFAKPVDVYIVSRQEEGACRRFDRETIGFSLRMDPRSIDPEDVVSLLQETLDEVHRIQVDQAQSQNQGVVLRAFKRLSATDERLPNTL
jgi:class 3 adenylate cyclase|tara:strand:+ start:18128 stop:19555 length:1428 start_codon:yes stop_codon:yes gene_type:complete